MSTTSFVCANGTLRVLSEPFVVEFTEGDFNDKGYTVPFEYRDVSTYSADELRQVDDFMSALFPSEGVREFMWNWMASLLRRKYGGGNFLIWNGSGGNGKTTLVRVLSTIFTNSGSIATENFTDSYTNPDLLVKADKDDPKLFYTINDYNNDQLDAFRISSVLTLPPPNIIYSYEWYLNNIIMDVNELPQFNKFKKFYLEDKYHRRGFIVVPFERKFVRGEPLEGQIKMRAFDQEEINKLASILFSVLVSRLKETKGEVKKTDAIKGATDQLLVQCVPETKLIRRSEMEQTKNKK